MSSGGEFNFTRAFELNEPNIKLLQTIGKHFSIIFYFHLIKLRKKFFVDSKQS